MRTPQAWLSADGLLHARLREFEVERHVNGHTYAYATVPTSRYPDSRRVRKFGRRADRPDLPARVANPTRPGSPGGAAAPGGRGQPRAAPVRRRHSPRNHERWTAKLGLSLTVRANTGSAHSYVTARLTPRFRVALRASKSRLAAADHVESAAGRSLALRRNDDVGFRRSDSSDALNRGEHRIRQRLFVRHLHERKDVRLTPTRVGLLHPPETPLTAETTSWIFPGSVEMRTYAETIPASLSNVCSPVYWGAATGRDVSPRVDSGSRQA